MNMLETYWKFIRWVGWRLARGFRWKLFRYIWTDMVNLPWYLRWVNRRNITWRRMVERVSLMVVMKFIAFFTPEGSFRDTFGAAEWAAIWNREDNYIPKPPASKRAEYASYYFRKVYRRPEEFCGSMEEAFQDKDQATEEFVHIITIPPKEEAADDKYFAPNWKYADKATGEPHLSALDVFLQPQDFISYLRASLLDFVYLKPVRREGKTKVYKWSSEYTEYSVQEWERLWETSYKEYSKKTYWELASDYVNKNWFRRAAVRREGDFEAEAKSIKYIVLNRCYEERPAEFCRGLEPIMEEVVDDLVAKDVLRYSAMAYNAKRSDGESGGEERPMNFSLTEKERELLSIFNGLNSPKRPVLESVEVPAWNNGFESINSLVGRVKGLYTALWGGKGSLGYEYRQDGSTIDFISLEGIAQYTPPGALGAIVIMAQWVDLFESWFLSVETYLANSINIWSILHELVLAEKERYTWPLHVGSFSETVEYASYVGAELFARAHGLWTKRLELENLFFGGGWSVVETLANDPYTQYGQMAVYVNSLRLDIITGVWVFLQPAIFFISFMWQNETALYFILASFGTIIALEPIYRGVMINPWYGAGRAITVALGGFTASVILGILLNTYSPIVSLSEVHPFFHDGLTTVFILLTLVIIHLCILVGWPIREHEVRFLGLISVLGALLVWAFSTSNLMVFYLVFETILIPTYALIGRWGSQAERTYAAFMFFLYTLVGSIFLLFALVTIQYHVGSFNYFEMLRGVGGLTLESQKLIWWCLVIGFAFKVPLFFVHTWLTVAHVEAPTVGSIILASLLLKLGGYGLIRFVLALLPAVTVTEGPIVGTVALLGYTLATISAIRQLDLKRFVAYTSIAHMNFSVLGLLTTTKVGYFGAIHSMFSHGLIAAGLFLLIGVVYDRFHVRNVLYFSGLATLMPEWSLLFFLLMLANSGFPFFSGFPGELYTLMGVFTISGLLGILAFIGFILTIVYTFLNLTRVLFGTPLFYKSYVLDIIETERVTLFFLVIGSLAIGVVPGLVFSFFY